MLGTVGESINPAAWEWYKRTVGGGNVPVIDTYWQTETGGILLCNMPGAWPEKPGSATFPFFGINLALLDPDTGKELTGAATGVLCIKQARPPPLHGQRFPCDSRKCTGSDARCVCAVCAVVPQPYNAQPRPCVVPPAAVAGLVEPCGPAQRAPVWT